MSSARYGHASGMDAINAISARILGHGLEARVLAPVVDRRVHT